MRFQNFLIEFIQVKKSGSRVVTRVFLTTWRRMRADRDFAVCSVCLCRASDTFHFVKEDDQRAKALEYKGAEKGVPFVCEKQTFFSALMVSRVSKFLTSS